MKQFKEHVRNSVNIGSNDYSTKIIIRGGFFMKRTVAIILISIILIGILGVNTEKVNAANGYPTFIYEGSYGKVRTNLRLRAKPTVSSEQIGLLYTDQWVFISGSVYENDGYHWAWSSAGGYIAIDYLKGIVYTSSNASELMLNFEVGNSYEFCSSDIGKEMGFVFMFRGGNINALRYLCDRKIGFKWGSIDWSSSNSGWCTGVVYITPQEAKDFTFSIEMLDNNWKSMKEFKLKFNYNQLNEGTKIYNYNGDEFIAVKNLSEKYCYKQAKSQCTKCSADIIVSLARNEEYHDIGWISGSGCTWRQSDGKSVLKYDGAHLSAQDKRNLVGTLAANGIPSAIRLGGQSSSKGHTVVCIGILKTASNTVSDDELLIIDPATAKIMVLSELKNSGYWYNGINGGEKDNGWSIFIPAEYDWGNFKLK